VVVVAQPQVAQVELDKQVAQVVAVLLLELLEPQIQVAVVAEPVISM
jgi:hypothetical protein